MTERKVVLNKDRIRKTNINKDNAKKWKKGKKRVTERNFILIMLAIERRVTPEQKLEESKDKKAKERKFILIVLAI